MKRCPECRRDYYDETLLYCLDDGNQLLEGPTTFGEAVTAVFPHDGQGAAAPVTRPGGEVNSIAVLPFANLSADPENDYFCDGLSEELLNALSKVNGLKVAARTSAFSFKGKNLEISQIAKALRVNTVLEGSVRRSGNRLRITTQLVNASDGYQLWSERYDRELEDVFDVQDEIALAIVDSLKLKLLGERRAALLRRYTDNTEAYQFYLRGRFYWNKRTTSGYQQAIDYFERAIELDSNYALAYSGISDCYNSSGFSFDIGAVPTHDLIGKAKASALKALQIDDSLAEAHTSLAYAKLLFDWDWQGAEEGFRRAIDLNPNYANAHHWYSHLLVALSRFDESLLHSRFAIDVDPLSAVLHTHLGWHYLYAREYDVAIEQLRRTLCIDPEFLHAQWYLAIALGLKGLHEDAEAEFQAATKVDEDTFPIQADAAYSYAVAGRRDETMRILDKLLGWTGKKYVSSFGLAMAYTGLGDVERAFEYLNKSFEEHSDVLVYLRVEPRLDTLRDDPRFDDLVNRVGFPD